MIAQTQNNRAFQNTPLVHSDKGNEFELIREITKQLKNLEVTEHKYHERAEIIYKNTKLWNFFLKSVMHPDNQLTDELKKSIAELAIFTIRQSELYLENKAPLAPLIDINIAIMNGLKGK